MIVALLALQYLLPILNTPSYIFPQPSVVISYIVSSQVPWGTHALATLSEAVLGYFVAVVFGIALAIVIHLSQVLRRVLEPIVLAFQVMPKIAIVPILFLWLGLDKLLPSVLTVFLVCFFPIVVATVSGLDTADKDLLDLVRSFNSSRLAALTKVSFPSALPSIFSGLKISITLAVLGAFVAEYVSSDKGLGYLIFSGQTTLNTPLVWASATVLVILGFLLYAAVMVVERLAMPWRREPN